MSFIKSLKLSFPLLISCALLLSTGGNVSAEGDQSENMESPREISPQSTSVIKMSLDPVLNKKFAAQQGYGLIPLSEHPDFFNNSETYASSDYQLILTTTGGGTTEYADSYAVYKMYKSVTKGDDIVTFEFQSNARPKSGINFVGFKESHWIEEPAYEVIDWSPKGTTKTTSGSTVKWEINPSYKDVLYPYLEQQLSGKYHFYTDLEGSSGYVESTGQELLKINEKIEKNTFKLQTNIPMKTELWYDKDTGILLKKIEYYNKNYVLRYEINLDSLRE